MPLKVKTSSLESEFCILIERAFAQFQKLFILLVLLLIQQFLEYLLIECLYLFDLSLLLCIIIIITVFTNSAASGCYYCSKHLLQKIYLLWTLLQFPIYSVMHCLINH
uniref:Uncharacterized protein n=1 Tax=Glossina brevipalpis TaxID=37001 RepID=A0A1A9W543_9MUSC